MGYRGGGPRRGQDRKEEQVRVNHRIRVREVRVISDDGEQLGILPTDEALRRAGDAGLDLVEVSPMARPPVCKIMDYGKFKYQQKRNAAQAKKKQHVIEVKEVKFRPKTDKHDFQVKMNRIQKFISAGNKCKVTIMFRGREIVHPDIGRDILVRVGDELESMATVESMPRMEGRQMFMILAPGKSGKKKPEQAAAPEAPAAAAAPAPEAKPAAQEAEKKEAPAST